MKLGNSIDAVKSPRRKSGPAFNMIEGSRVVAVMSRDEEKAKSYAIRHQIPRWYTDAQELIGDEDVNAIYIATPPSSHATFAIMAMKAGKPVYIEKPMAASYEDCARINRISKETGVPCFVAYYRRYLPYFQKVRQFSGRRRNRQRYQRADSFCTAPARTRLQQQEFAMARAT